MFACVIGSHVNNYLESDLWKKPIRSIHVPLNTKHTIFPLAIYANIFEEYGIVFRPPKREQMLRHMRKQTFELPRRWVQGYANFLHLHSIHLYLQNRYLNNCLKNLFIEAAPRES